MILLTSTTCKNNSKPFFLLIYLCILNLVPRFINYTMPRYVAKEDVEKGLVDPTRPLEEQPEYKQKVEK